MKVFALTVLGIGLMLSLRAEPLVMIKPGITVSSNTGRLTLCSNIEVALKHASPKWKKVSEQGSSTIEKAITIQKNNCPYELKGKFSIGKSYFDLEEHIAVNGHGVKCSWRLDNAKGIDTGGLYIMIRLPLKYENETIIIGDKPLRLPPFKDKLQNLNDFSGVRAISLPCSNGKVIISGPLRGMIMVAPRQGQYSYYELRLYCSPSRGIIKESKISFNLSIETNNSNSPDMNKLGKDRCLDLSPYVNMGFRDLVAGDGIGGWSDEGADNDWGDWDYGVNTYCGIPFAVTKPRVSGGPTVLTFDSPYARTGLKEVSLSVIEDQPSARFLYLLHTSCFNKLKPNTPVGKVEVEFTDGSVVQKEVRNANEIGDWWYPHNGENMMVAVRKTQNNREIGVYLCRLHLGREDKTVRSIRLKTSAKATWIVVGATLSSRQIDIDSKTLRIVSNQDWQAVNTDGTLVLADSALDQSSLSVTTSKNKPLSRLGINRIGKLCRIAEPDTLIRLHGYPLAWNFPSYTTKISDAEIKNLVVGSRRQGYNLLRLVYVDRASLDQDMNLRQDVMDRYDFLLAQMGESGVYMHLTIMAYGFYLKNPNLNRPWELKLPYNDFKAKMFLGDPEVRKLWKYGAETFMSHINPYTGVAWKDDPTIACVEFFNEQSFGVTRLDQLSEPVREAFQIRFVDWLRQKYRSPEIMAHAWNSPVIPFEQVKLPKTFREDSPWANDFLLFCNLLARANAQWCESVIRHCGYKGLTAQYNMSYGLGNTEVMYENSQIAMINRYHDHPTNQSTPDSVCRQHSSISNDAWYWRSANATLFADRPAFVTEYNHAFWNRYQYECGIVFGAYSALRGLDALIVQGDAVIPSVTTPNSAWSVGSNPVARAGEFLLNCLYLRGDVKTSAKRVELDITRDFFSTQCRSRDAVSPEQDKIGLLCGFSISFPDAVKPPWAGQPRPADLTIQARNSAGLKTHDWFVTSDGNFKDKSFSLNDFIPVMKQRGLLPMDNITNPKQGIFQSNTGEIVMRTKELLMKVVTPKTEAVALTGGKGEPLHYLTVVNTSADATVAVCAVDDQEIASSNRLVLLYSTRVLNTDMEFADQQMAKLKKIGRLPILMKTGQLSVKLKNYNSNRMSLYALGLDGSRREKLPTTVQDGTIFIRINTGILKNGPTPFFELVSE